jgi:hypothetical protein
VDKNLPAGEHLVTWRPGNLPDGVYFFRISAGESVITKRMNIRK